jgi:hypothetical protein
LLDRAKYIAAKDVVMLDKYKKNMVITIHARLTLDTVVVDIIGGRYRSIQEKIMG